MNELTQEQMQMAMGYFGGPQTFQQCVNDANNNLQQMGMNPQQYLQQQLQSGNISQDRMQYAMQMANQILGGR